MPATDTVIPAFEDLFVDPRSLPSPSMSVLQLLRRADDPEVSMGEIAHLIESDVALAVQVLRMANSALYSPGREVTTVGRALASLGLRTVKLLALTSSLRSLIPQHHDAVDTHHLRYRMVVTAGLAKRAAQLLDPPRQEEALVAGLLTGIGPVVLAGLAPAAAHLVAGSGATWPRPERERELLGYTTDDISTELVTRWGLPAVFSEALRHRRSPALVDGRVDANSDGPDDGSDGNDSGALNGCLQLATLAEPILTGGGFASDVSQFRDGIRHLAGLDEDHADQWLLDAEAVVTDTAELLQFRIPHETAYSELLAEAADRVLSLQEALDAQLFHNDDSVDELAKRNDELEAEASTDPLTKLPNRRAFDRRMTALLDRTPRRFGLLMIDLDHFKDVNDAFGHAVGDDVLRLVGSTLRHQTRGDDFAARFGGEEFVMLLPADGPDALVVVGDRLREAIANLVITLPGGSQLTVTASVGGAMIDAADDPHSARSLIEVADAQLYMAKERGRNRTCIA